MQQRQNFWEEMYDVTIVKPVHKLLGFTEDCPLYFAMLKVKFLGLTQTVTPKPVAQVYQQHSFIKYKRIHMVNVYTW